eukprot:scaffold102_cov27-Tisochrysis_lutea.AAC.4
MSKGKSKSNRGGKANMTAHPARMTRSEAFKLCTVSSRSSPPSTSGTPVTGHEKLAPDALSQSRSESGAPIPIFATANSASAAAS